MNPVAEPDLNLVSTRWLRGIRSRGQSIIEFRVFPVTANRILGQSGKFGYFAQIESLRKQSHCVVLDPKAMFANSRGSSRKRRTMITLHSETP